MARAIDWAARRDTDEDGAFLAVNAGSDDWNYRIRDLAEAVASVIPGVEVVPRDDAAPDKRSYRVSFERFRALAPEHQPEVGLRSRGRRAERRPASEWASPTRTSGRSHLMRLFVLQDLRECGLVNDQLSGSRMSTRKHTPAEAGSATARAAPRCRSCDAALGAHVRRPRLFPLANAYLTEAQLEDPEPFYPLRVYVCDRCFLVQLRPVATPEEHLQRLRVLLVLLRQLAPARTRVRRAR